jgi:tetratricopeptide (TPR) repeat protein
MLKINKSLLLALFISNYSLARSYDDMNLAEFLNKRGYKYFANYFLKDLKKTKDLAYREHFESLYLLNLINDSDDKYEFARLEKLISESKVKNAKLCYALAKNYEQRENYTKSLELYNQISPANDEINLKKVCLNIIVENFDAALDILKEVNDKYENEKHFYKGLILFNQKEYEQALNTLDLIKDDPKFENKIPCLIAQCYIEQKKYRTVINYIKKLEKNNIDFENKMDVYRIAGDAALLVKKYEEAIDFYNKALNSRNFQIQTAQLVSLAPAPSRQQLDVISLDDLDEIADIEAEDNDDIEEESLIQEEKTVKKENKPKQEVVVEKAKEEKKDEEKEEVDKQDNDEENGEDDEEEKVEMPEPVFNIYDEIGMRLGFAYYKNKKYEEAKMCWQSVSNCNPKLYQLANYYTGVLALREKKNEEALNTFNKALEIICDSDIQPELLVYCAGINYNMQNFNDAKEFIKKFKTSFPNHRLSKQIDILNFKIAANEKNYDSIISEFESVKNKDDIQKELLQRALLFKGNALFNKNKYNEAKDLFEKSIEMGISFKLNNDAYFGLGECYTYLKDYSHALEEYKNIDRTSDKYPRAALGVAYILFNSQNYDAAYRKFSEIYRNYKGKFDTNTVIDIQNRIADCLFVKKKYKEALKVYQLNSNDHSRFYQGIIYDIWNNSSQALNCLQKIGNTSKYHEKALLEIGTIQLSCCQFTKAKDTFSTLISDYPNSPYLGTALFKRATAHGSLKHFDKAREDYRTFLDTFPGDQNYSHVLMNLLEITKDESQRKEIMAKYKTQFKLSAISFNDGKNYFYEQDYPKAIEIFEKYVAENKNDKNFDEACFLLAEAYRFTKKVEKSLSLYEILTNKERSNFFIKALIKLGTIYRVRGEHEKAIKCFDKLRLKSKTNRDKIFALNGLMNEYYQLKNFEQAIKFANECLGLKVENTNVIVDSNLTILRCEFELKMFNQVLKKCQGFAKDEKFKNVQDEILFLKAKCLYEVKKHDESLNTLYDLTKNYQNSKWVEECYIVMAKNYIAQNKISQANQTLDSIIQHSKDEKLKEIAKSLKVNRKRK